MVYIDRYELFHMRRNFVLLLLAGFIWLTPAIAYSQEVAEIEITGLEGELLQQAIANITVTRELAAATTARTLDRRVRQAVTQLDNALKVNGYYSADITPHVLEQAEKRFFRFVVVKGEPVRIGTLRLDITGDGADFREFQDWKNSFPLETGDILVDTRYEEALTELQRKARKYGFFDSQISRREIRIDRSTLTADIHIEFESGARFRYGEIRLLQDYFDTDFLQRFFNIEPGQSFNNDDLQVLHQRFSASDYFSSIRLSPLLDERSGDEVPISIELERRKRDRYFAGIGYSTDLGVRGKLGMDRRYVNSRGHNFSALLDYAELKRQARVAYNIPLSRPYTENLVLSYVYSDRRDEDLKSRVNGIDATRIWKRGLHDWQYGIWFFTADNELDGEQSEGEFLAPSAGWSYARADNFLFPRKAWQLGLNIVGASESIVSTESFLQARLNTTLIFPAFEYDRLLLRGQVGRTFIENFSVLPKQLRFYAGGDNSVRGYEYQSLAPYNENGSLVGGDSLIFGSAEYEHYFRREIGVAVFWDSGNAFFAGDAINLEHGAGVGLHLNLPFGVFRFDVANALSKPDRPWRLHVTLRPDL
jgi:translocation and assembly module TamA